MLKNLVRFFSFSLFLVPSSLEAQENYNPLSEVGDRVLSWNFTSAQDLSQKTIIETNERLVPLGLDPSIPYYYSSRKLFNPRKTEFWYALKICPQNSPSCLSTSSAPYLAIVNYKRNEYILLKADALGKGRVCINGVQNAQCHDIDNYGKDWPITSDFFYGINFQEGARLIYNWAHILPNSRTTTSRCIKETSYDKSVTYEVLKNDGFGWRRTGGTYTDANRGIDIRNVCNIEIYLLQRSRLTGSDVVKLSSGQSYQTTAFDYQIDFYAVSGPSPL